MAALKIVGLIPARSGSKRLPGKNLRALAGKPLVAWTIEFARKCSALSHVILSTDDPKIAAVAERYGLQVPDLRPETLARDETTAMEVVLFEIEKLRRGGARFDALMLLQPTTPFRRHVRVSQATEMLKAELDSPIVSVSPVKHNPQWCVSVSGDGLLAPWLNQPVPARSQLLRPAFCYNGSLYLAAISTLEQERSFITKKTRALIMDDPVESIDIDSASDWCIAEMVAANSSFLF